MEINKIKTYIGKIVYCVSDTNQIYIFKFENIINDKIHTNDFIVYDSLISDYVYIDKYDNNPLISLNEIKIFNEAYQEQIDMYIDRKNLYNETGLVKPVKYIDDYQGIAVSTAIYPREMKGVYPVLGLSGEVGEVAEKVKKIYRDKNGEFSNNDIIEIKKELGDIMWYIANMAEDLGISLYDIINTNVYKILSRQKRNQISGNGDNR